MTMTYSLNRSPRRLCEEMEPFIPPMEQERLVRRPFNHYTPALTDWWIVPSLDLPFFKFGKYFFTWDVKQRTSIQCGLCLTKGLDPMLAAVYPSRKGRRLLMDESWAWNRFHAAVEKGVFEEKLRRSARAIGHEVEIVFDGGYVDDPGLFNPDAETRRRDRYTLVYQPEDDSLRVARAKRDAMCLKFLNKVHSISEFREAMRTLAAEQFLWCDIFVSNSYLIPLTEEFPAEAEVRSAREIYDEWLGFWREFV